MSCMLAYLDYPWIRWAVAGAGDDGDSAAYVGCCSDDHSSPQIGYHLSCRKCTRVPVRS